MEYFKDRNGNRYEIYWHGTDVTICGFFAGSINNIHEWIYANLGYGNKMQRIKNIDNGVEYFIGQDIIFTEKTLNCDLQEVKSGTINEFYIDSFSDKIGATFEEKIGRHELYGCVIKLDTKNGTKRK